jgi:hypothetical protein
MTALESIGVPLDDILIPDEISRAALRNLQKKSVPSALAWFPFDQLPAMRWAGGKGQIPRETPVWWLMQANQLKTPEPGALLRRQLRLVHADDRETFGLAVLQAWIDYDTMPGTWEQVRQAAQRQRDMLLKIADFEPAFAEKIPPLDDLIQAFLQQPGGSAIKCKGLLAIPAACGGERSVQLAIDYIRKWYGIRASQSKALVQLLSWVETPSSIQFLTATARSFRTKGIQDQAHKALQSLAARRGWTVDELADRMVPDAGLDEHGRLLLDFGARRFVAELDPAFRLQVRDSEGRLRRDLPKPGKSDDETAAAEARQAFARAKKQIRGVVKEQSDRLFCAMCVGRQWRLDEWTSHLAEHPIVGRLCRQIVWRAEWPGNSMTFRPRSAREWMDSAARTMELAPDALVSIAHDVNTPPDCSVPWIAHFEQYAIEPLFPQFNRGLPELSDLALDAVSINDFEGWLIGAYALAAAARKLGYRRGGGMDGPTFYDYRRSFPSLRLEVYVEFTGQDFYEGDRPVALQRMTFKALPDPAADDQRHRVLTLAEVPPILLLESFRDLREIALAGDGRHPLPADSA